MTSPSGPSTITPNSSIHNQPSSKSPKRGAPFSAGQLEAIGTYLIDSILAKVLLAVSGISVFGIHPFAGLANCANNLMTQATNALANATNAQGSANLANGGVNSIYAYLSGTAVGGVHGSEAFPGSSSSSLGSSYNEYYTGSGAGTLGLSGDGKARWHASGLLFGRQCIAVRNDVTLVTDQQKSWLLLTDVVDHGAQVFLFNRCNANDVVISGATYHAGQNGVFAVLSAVIGGGARAQLGYMVNGSMTYFGSAQAYSASPGDVYGLQIGTASNPREYILQHNGNTLINYIDSGTSSMMGAGFRNPGFGVSAAGGLFGETGPPDLESFTWCDAA